MAKKQPFTPFEIIVDSGIPDQLEWATPSKPPKREQKHETKRSEKNTSRKNSAAAADRDLRALSVRQPWASLLIAGVKRFEVRTWRPKHDHLFALVHASSGKAGGLPDLRKAAHYQRAVHQAKMEDETSWPQSALLGLVEIKTVWEPGDTPPGFTDFDEFLCGAVDDHYLWEVGRRWPFASPINCHGKLNLWRVDQSLWADVNGQLDAVEAPVRLSAK